MKKPTWKEAWTAVRQERVLAREAKERRDRNRTMEDAKFYRACFEEDMKLKENTHRDPD